MECCNKSIKYYLIDIIAVRTPELIHLVEQREEGDKTQSFVSVLKLFQPTEHVSFSVSTEADPAVLTVSVASCQCPGDLEHVWRQQSRAPEHRSVTHATDHWAPLLTMT